MSKENLYSGKRILDNNIDDIISNLEKNLKIIENESKKIFIVNAGRMNHGKSSLFNSLLDKQYFATGDVRTTVARSDAEFRPNVFLVDTPGLDAVDCDDKVAFDAYKKANMVVFVHTPNVGELHKNEINRLNEIKRFFPNNSYFWRHFCLVLTFAEAVDVDNLALIEKKILTDIKDKCDGSGFPVFRVSNIRYGRGKAEDKAALIKNSGVDELRLFLIKKLTQWKTEANVLAKERKNKLIKDVCNELTSERDEYEKEYYIKHKKIEQHKQNVIKIIDEIFAEIEEYQKYLRNNMRVVNQLEEMVRDLQQKHIQEKRNYY